MHNIELFLCNGLRLLIAGLSALFQPDHRFQPFGELAVKVLHILCGQPHHARCHAGFRVGKGFLCVVHKRLIPGKFFIKYLDRDIVDGACIILPVHPLIGFQCFLHDIRRDGTGYLLLLPFPDCFQTRVTHFVSAGIQFRPADKGHRQICHDHSQLYADHD